MKISSKLFACAAILLLPAMSVAQVEIEFNSSHTLPQLILDETADDYARLHFRNSNSASAFWSMMGKISSADSLSRFRLFYEGYDISAAPLSITGDLRVGIGMLDPPSRLSLKQAMDADHMGFRIVNAASTGSSRMWMNGNDLLIYAGSNDANGLTFKPTGRIGAFTDSPEAKFTIYEENYNATEDLFLVSRQKLIDNIIYPLRILEAKEDGNVYIRKLGVYEDTPTHQLDINTDNAEVNPFRVRVQDITKFRVLSNGGTSIGSGNASPPEDGLHVEGQVHIGTNAAGTDRLQVRSVSGENAFRVVVNTETKLRVLSNGGTSIGSNNETPPENGLYVNGNVHIGTTAGATGYKLAVDGKAICEELTVELSGEWPDYVFEPDYNLAPLETVHAYIREHKHLPGVPSAAQMASNGINTSEMLKALTEKIEQLTLYMITQEEKIESLQVQIHQLVKQNPTK